ncbi:NAD(P)-dependent dehydrogenase (short-subunit alcohol dehydrogenase family) [Streptomyces sp. SAI-144]|jgi:NAD(P)-dependent dehydrogenase (short-subunit alcohol dehydrogenase family)|uniref:SDR family NAD(P)-dependent oxidoreductase n=1 Tax=Streptomyces sp. SAI-144 TaxID=2940544 RepID=UPI002475CDF2|nr:SDR family NAD(P)-dependent oxidoreductase [Streptomyces sp. SAI-144]MDH6438906.1 NAD(P)-dependent dehydrogenase (short-subunit alcohol dehydrogenase family) [Streptomyces sp. SAI-144]
MTVAAAPARFTGRTALLTAAASGIGAATARRLATEGASVLVTDVDAKGAQRVAEDIRAVGGRARDQHLDVTSASQWDAAVAEAESWTGRLDVLHLNAGQNLPGAAHELDDAAWHDQLRLCLDSVFYGVRAAVPLLRAARGTAVITSSVHAVVGFKGFPAYAAAKGGIDALVRQLAVEYAGQIRFNAVLPGAVETALWAEVPQEYKARTVARTPVGRLGAPEDIAAAVAFLASEDASFVTGQNLLVDGGRSISSQE